MARKTPPEPPSERAAQLLRQVLTPEEQHHYTKTGNITITGSKGGKYEVGTGSCSGNIRPLQSVWVGTDLRRRRATPTNLLCAHPRLHHHDAHGYYLGTLPVLDAIVTQVLTIKADEKHFLRTALIYL